MAMKTFEQTFPGHYPSEMRRQLWPLCCGASIISGFKDVGLMTEAQLVDAIEDTLDAVPDFQVFAGETIVPKLTFLTLNAGQMGSKKIMQAIEKAGFFKIGEASPRHTLQGFFVRDDSKTWKTTEAI